MKPLTHARKELRSAQRAIESMRKSTSLDSLEEAWVAYLRHIERTWNKAQAQLKKSSKFQGWPQRGRAEALRSRDPLLSYLRNARGCDEHGVEPIAEKIPGGIGINAAEGNSLYIKKMEMRNGQLHIDSPQKIKITIDPGKFHLVPVINRGVTYAVPTSHLGSDVVAMDPASLAELAVKFYVELLDQAEAEFVK
jgi:hypothetical protein